MSTHVLDASGARPLTTTMNDPAATRASIPAKQGDDVKFTIGAAREITLRIPDSARLQVRRYKVTTHKGIDPETKEPIVDERYDDALVLVFAGQVNLFARSSFRDEEANAYAEEHDGNKPFEGTPHTTMWVKRNGDDLDWSESGELLVEHQVGDLIEPSAD